MKKVHLVYEYGVERKYGCNYACVEAALGNTMVYPSIFKLIPKKHRCKVCDKAYRKYKEQKK